MATLSSAERTSLVAKKLGEHWRYEESEAQAHGLVSRGSDVSMCNVERTAVFCVAGCIVHPNGHKLKILTMVLALPSPYDNS